MLLLAPRQDYPFEPAQVPDEVVQLRWQDTARIIREWSTDDPVGRFLLAELTAYLREEDLVDPEDLTGEHLVALDVHREALNALDRVCELAATRVDSRWNDGDGPGQYGQPVRERWWTHPWVPATQSVDLDDAWGLCMAVDLRREPPLQRPFGEPGLQRRDDRRDAGQHRRSRTRPPASARSSPLRASALGCYHLAEERVRLASR